MKRPRTGSARLGIGVRGGGSVSAIADAELAMAMAASSSAAPVRAAPKVAAKSAPAYPQARRGSIAEALAAAASPETMQEAVDVFRRDKYAASSAAARASWLRTWCTLHSAAHAGERPQAPPFPLTVGSIQKVAALFKAGRYLSFDNYINRAKAEHLALGLVGAGAWSAELERAVKDSIRSVNRGAGTSRQSQPLDATKVAELDLCDEPAVEAGPIAPTDWCTVGCFFLLREIEISAARTGHVTMAADCSWATMLLPTSKTDVRAVGVSRTYDCCCSAPGLARACPVHALDRQLRRCRHLATTLHLDFGSLPLFPDKYGGEVEKAHAVATINSLASSIGQPVVDELGALLFGGHSLRTGGAHLLSARGVNPFKIQAMGRWRSPLVIHYAGAAMATNIAADLGAGSGSVHGPSSNAFV